MMMTNAHFLQTPSYAHRFFRSQAMLMVALALDSLQDYLMPSKRLNV